MNVLVTSRPTLDLEEVFQECILHESLEIRARDEDVERYLEGRIAELKASIPDLFWKQIKEAISKAAEGMYVLLEILKIPD